MALEGDKGLRELIGGNIPDYRRERKIIAALVRSDFNILGRKDIDLAAGERDRLTASVKNGSIRFEDFLEIADSVRAKTKGLEDQSLPNMELKVFEEIAAHKQSREMLGIIAYFSLGHLARRSEVAVGHLAKMLKQFPTVSEYLKATARLISELSALTHREQKEERKQRYMAAARELGRIAYGRQWDYLSQASVLWSEIQNRLEQEK